MKELKWFYYNHALLPTIAPHEKVDETLIKKGKLWKEKWEGIPLLIRWTTDFDCSEKTEWWYCIKDTIFDISSLKSDRRYKINKGKRNFKIKVIDPLEYGEQIYEVQKAAFLDYPEKYRPKINKDDLLNDIKNRWSNYEVYGAFNNENILCGYLLFLYNNKCINLVSLKTNPKFEKLQINAAIVAVALESVESKLKEGFYICDGERNILHETSFQEYLEKYFGFRKAYCKLHIEYRFIMRIIINILYPFKGILKKLDNNIFLTKVIAILYMEELRRKSE